MAGGDGRQVGDRVPAGEGSPWCSWSSRSGAVAATIEHNVLEVGTLEGVQRFRIDWQLLARCGGHHDQPPPGLGDAIVAGLQHVEADLVAHPHQGGEDQLEHHPSLVCHQVSNILEDEEPGPVEVAVAEVSGDQAVLELAVLLLLEVVQDTEPLARRSTTHDVNLGLKCMNLYDDMTIDLK